MTAGPPLVHPMPDIKAVVGRSVHIICPASGFPLERITWARGDTAIGAELLNREPPVYPGDSRRCGADQQLPALRVLQRLAGDQRGGGRGRGEVQLHGRQQARAHLHPDGDCPGTG